MTTVWLLKNFIHVECVSRPSFRKIIDQLLWSQFLQNIHQHDHTLTSNENCTAAQLENVGQVYNS